MYPRAKLAREEWGVWSTRSCWEGEEKGMPTSWDATRPERVEEVSVLQRHPDRAATNGQSIYFNQSNCLNITIKRNRDLSVPDFSR